MNKELQQKLLEALTASMDAIKNIKDFTIDQAPDIIHQSLTWYSIYYFISFLIAIGLIGICIYGVFHIYKYRHLFLDKDGYPNILVIFTFLGYVASIIIITMSLNLQWLQIWVAPKLWLIEWITKLKG